MPVGERIYDLAADPIKGAATGGWHGMKKGAVALGLTAAVVTLAIFGVTTGALWGALAAGVLGFAVGGAGGAAVGGAGGHIMGTMSGIKKFLVGRENTPGTKEAEMAALRAQVAAEEAQLRAMQLQKDRIAAMDGANPDAATNNAAKLTKQAQAATMATGAQRT